MSSQTGTSRSPSYSLSQCIISCHCGACRQSVELELQRDEDDGNGNADRAPTGPGCPSLEITLCHCYTCRHTTGQMFTSWARIRVPADIKTDNKNLQKFRVVKRHVVRSSNQQGRGSKGTEKEGGDQRGREHEVRAGYYFCGTCGCHLFRRVSSRLRLETERTDDERGGEELPRAEYAHDMEEEEEQCTWEVATGVILEDSLMSTGSGSEDAQQSGLHTQLTGIQWRHEKVGKTKDGGLAVWLHHGKDGSAIDRPQEVEMKAVGTEKDSRKASSSPHAVNPREEVHLRQQDDDKDEDTLLQATCHCENVSFSILRPSTNPTSSTAPRSNFPDLMYPYISTPEAVISNSDDVKWWLRVPSTLLEEEEGNEQEGKVKVLPGTKYLAGTCACRSCRLTSGFEIQSWAFIPRGNILMDLPLVPLEKAPVFLPSGREGGGGRRTVPLEFPSPSDIYQKELGGNFNKEKEKEKDRDKAVLWPLKSYESSPGVVREFCPFCGATVFWHDKWRPDLIDVSVGLLRFPGDVNVDVNSGSREMGYHNASGSSGRAELEAEADGARHESWLEWWRERVSFAEDAGLDRVGGCSVWGRDLVGELGRCLKLGKTEVYSIPTWNGSDRRGRAMLKVDSTYLY